MTGRRPVSLSSLLAEAKVPAIDIMGNPMAMVTGISSHAQRTVRNEMFAAITGTRTDSHMMLGEAVDAGASVLLVEKETKPYPGVTTVRVSDTRLALGRLAHALRGNPARRMNVCGITGTNGKSSTSHLLHWILRSAGANAGLIGTLGIEFGGKCVTTLTTTPGPLELAEVFHAMDGENVECVVMEVSSHAIDQERISGIPFRNGAFLNITQDHLDYHGTMEEYARTKKRLFFDYIAPTPGSTACFNMDDSVGLELAEEYDADFLTFSQRAGIDAAVKIGQVECSLEGTRFVLRIGGKPRRVYTPLLGQFNIENILAAVSCASSLGVEPGAIVRGLETAPPVPGRFEFLREGQDFTVIVDYAHTPDALDRLLRSVRRLCPGKVITVFGCGGDRDRAKRPVMGKVVGDHSDFAILTSDNPRTEDPALIARQTLEGVLQSSLKSNRYQTVLKRQEAIEQALHLAGPNDVVIIAGKGHEDYQEIGTTRLPFDDRLVARALLRQMLGGPSQTEWLESAAEPSP